MKSRFFPSWKKGETISHCRGKRRDTEAEKKEKRPAAKHGKSGLSEAQFFQSDPEESVNGIAPFQE